MDAPFAVTLDFHDTLFSCDDWFTLEVEELVPAFLAWRGGASRAAPSVALGHQGKQRYRALRREVIASGLERDAVRSVIDVCAVLGLAVSRDEVEAGVEALMRGALATAEPMPGARQLVADLRAAGFRLAVISNAVHHPFLEWALAAHGLCDAFSAVVSSASAGYYKSRPEIFTHTLGALGVPAARAVHVGDSYRFDVQGAAAVGMRTVWFDRRREAGPDHRADLSVDSLDELAPRIRELLNFDAR